MMFKGYSTGAVDYIMKPVEPEILRAKVRVFVDLAIARQDLKAEVAERERVAAEVRQLNGILEERNRELLAANSDLEEFGHTVAHDLRAPLRHIAGYVRLLEGSAATKLDSQELRQLTTVKDAARRMNELISDLLTFSRLGGAQMNKRLVSMETLLRETVSDLESDLAHRKIVWQILPLPDVFGDRGLLRLVLENLVGNAVKYTRPRDPARIEIGGCKGDGELIFHVRDNGVGFRPDLASKLFGVFSRLHDAEEFEGTGIGLATVRRIVEKHGGRVWANAEEGAGATFCFALPIREA
jgi:light-regulated signal transduction histidine kinase (bacteriophytochrome)